MNDEREQNAFTALIEAACNVVYLHSSEGLATKRSYAINRLSDAIQAATDQPTEPEPGEGWRLLAKEEPLQPGDEMWAGKEWIDSTNARSTKKQSKVAFYRRRITPTSDTPEPWTYQAPATSEVSGATEIEYATRAGRFNIARADWVAEHWEATGSWAPIAWRPAKEPKPQWHDDAAPTVDQVADDEKRWVAWSDGTQGTAKGFLIRRRWKHSCTSELCINAWNDQQPPKPYQPPYQPPTTWQRTAERPPTEADGDSGGYVSAVDSHDALLRVVWHDVATRPDAFPEWIPTAALLNACRD